MFCLVRAAGDKTPRLPSRLTRHLQRPGRSVRRLVWGFPADNRLASSVGEQWYSRRDDSLSGQSVQVGGGSAVSSKQRRDTAHTGTGQCDSAPVDEVSACEFRHVVAFPRFVGFIMP